MQLDIESLEGHFYLLMFVSAMMHVAFYMYTYCTFKKKKERERK